jgi:hypothetical protein
VTLKLRGAMLAVFLSGFLLTVRGHYGSDQFMSYLTAESLVLDQRLAIGVRPFTLPDIQGSLERAPLGASIWLVTWRPWHCRQRCTTT